MLIDTLDASLSPHVAKHRRYNMAMTCLVSTLLLSLSLSLLLLVVVLLPPPGDTENRRICWLVS